MTDAINDDVTHFIIPTLKFVGSSLTGVKKIFGTRTLVSPMPDMIPLLLLVQSLVAGSKKGKNTKEQKIKKKTLLPKINITTKNDDIIDLDDKITKTTI